jgi:5-methylcytosine-specific restriction endonuclease McrA
MATTRRGEANSFWGRTHSAYSKSLISVSRKGQSIGNKHALGYRHSEEAKKRIAEAARQAWLDHREEKLAGLPRGDKHPYHKPPELRRHRRQFSPMQSRTLTGTICAFCGIAENLELDHIIPIFDGGTNADSNAQTLCRGCNLWKVKHVDLPRYFSRLAAQGG